WFFLTKSILHLLLLSRQLSLKSDFLIDNLVCLPRVFCRCKNRFLPNYLQLFEKHNRFGIDNPDETIGLPLHRIQSKFHNQSTTEPFWLPDCNHNYKLWELVQKAASKENRKLKANIFSLFCFFYSYRKINARIELYFCKKQEQCNPKSFYIPMVHHAEIQVREVTV